MAQGDMFLKEIIWTMLESAKLQTQNKLECDLMYNL